MTDDQNIPDDISKRVIFSQATDEQLDTVWRLNAQVWASPLSVEAHMERERLLSEQALTKSGAWRTWVLTLPDRGNEVVASCETFEKTILISNSDGVRKKLGYGIASVFTNQEYRRKGMATLLLDRLKKWLDGEGEGVVSVLYSDIGRNFYDKLGWKPFPAHQVTLAIEGDCLNEIEEPVKRVQLLGQDDVQALCNRDIDSMTHELKGACSATEDINVHVAFIPTFDQACWHFAREDYMAKRSLQTLEVKGVISESGKAWMYWHHDILEHKLKVQRVVLLDRTEYQTNVEELLLLLLQALVSAFHGGIRKVVVWNPCEELRDAARGVASNFSNVSFAIGERKDASIPSLRLAGGRGQPVVWHANEYYAWC